MEENNNTNENKIDETQVKKEDELLKTKQELEETQDRYKRIMAEFDNYKKRNQKEREGLYNSLVSDIVTSFLPILDNLEKAVNAETADEGYKQGVQMVQKQFIDTLANLGVTPIETIGEQFNPELHEAVSSVEAEDLKSGTIKEEFRKGYKIGQKVIRHSMVVVVN